MSEKADEQFKLKVGSIVSAMQVSGTVLAEVITYPQKLLAIAQGLIESNEFSISVVVAHIACEVATDRAFSKAFKEKHLEFLEEPIESFFSGNSLGNKKIRKLYTALTDDYIENQPFWSKFKESAVRRNKISHNGVIVGKVEAEESLAAARAFVAHLEK